MIYHKFETERGHQVNEVYCDEFVAYCIGCFKELKVEPEEIAQILIDGDFAGTSLKCGGCVLKDRLNEVIE